MTNRPAATTASATSGRMVRIGLVAAVLVFLVAGGALLLARSVIERWIANDVVEIGGPFSLVNQDGEAFTRDDLIGHPHILYFGFTYCPDLCPTTLFQIAGIVEGLGSEAGALKVAFISVDPERDTAAVLKAYVSAFHDSFIGLTGSLDAVDAAAKAYRIFYRKVPLEDGDYTVDHSAAALLFSADGSYAGAIAYDESDAAARAKIEGLVAAHSSG